jgi:hypothetical protein
MALESKMLMTAAGQSVARARTLKEAYMCIAQIANVEGVCLPSYEDARAQFDEFRDDCSDRSE